MPIAGYTLVLVAALSSAVHVTPPETVRTSLTYDSGTRRLVLGCDAASRGLCIFEVADGSARRRLAVPPRRRVVVSGVTTGAKVCARGRNPGVQCDWQPVVDSAA